MCLISFCRLINHHGFSVQCWHCRSERALLVFHTLFAINKLLNGLLTDAIMPYLKVGYKKEIFWNYEIPWNPLKVLKLSPSESVGFQVSLDMLYLSHIPHSQPSLMILFSIKPLLWFNNTFYFHATILNLWWVARYQVAYCYTLSPENNTKKS